MSDSIKKISAYVTSSEELVIRHFVECLRESMYVGTPQDLLNAAIAAAVGAVVSELMESAEMQAKVRDQVVSALTHLDRELVMEGIAAVMAHRVRDLVDRELVKSSQLRKG